MKAATDGFRRLALAAVVLAAVVGAGCRTAAPARINPVVYFEIPVADMPRAMRFYTAVFGFALERERIDGYEMARFPRTDGAPGASGALAKGDVYKPSMSGPIVYFAVDDIEETFRRAEAHGGRRLYPKTAVGGQFVGEIADSEGNRIALNADR
jgi:predicted enzyme related to lactoylglutathione lyase